MCRDNFQVSAFQNRGRWRRTASKSLPTTSSVPGSRGSGPASATLPQSRSFPLRERNPLPGFVGFFRRAWHLRLIEIQKARLGSRIEVHLQRVVVLPGDVQPPGLTHNAANTESLTLDPSLIIFREIPCIGDTPAFCVERKTLIVPFARRCHPVTPVFTDNRDPVSGEFDRRHRLGRYRRAPLSSSLSLRNRSSREE